MDELLLAYSTPLSGPWFSNNRAINQVNRREVEQIQPRVAAAAALGTMRVIRFRNPDRVAPNIAISNTQRSSCAATLGCVSGTALRFACRPVFTFAFFLLTFDLCEPVQPAENGLNGRTIRGGLSVPNDAS